MRDNKMQSENNKIIVDRNVAERMKADGTDA